MIENAAIFWSLHQDLEIVDRKVTKTVTFIDDKKYPKKRNLDIFEQLQVIKKIGAPLK